MLYPNIFKIIDEVKALLKREESVVFKGATLKTTSHSLPDLTDTAAIAACFPAGCIPLGATVRVGTAVTTDDSPPSNTFDVGITGGDADAFGNDIAGAAGTTTDQSDFTVDPTSLWAATAQGVTIAPTAGSFLTGALTVEVSYLLIQEPPA